MPSKTSNSKIRLDAKFFKKEFNLKKQYNETLYKLIKVLFEEQTSNIAAISRKIEGGANDESKNRKLRRFLSKVEIEANQAAKVIVKILGINTEPKWVIILDRSYWMYGGNHINFLYLSVYYKGYGIPLYIKMLPYKKGHSSVTDRAELVEKFIGTFGKHKIKYIVGDREFIGHSWFNYLKERDIPYVQRLKENCMHISDERGKMVSAIELCDKIKPFEVKNLGKREIYARISTTTNVTVTKNTKGTILLLAHSDDIKNPCECYRLRWAIELGFRALKSHGFNMNKTHIVDPKRLTCLFSILNIALAYIFALGNILEEISPIKIKANLRKAYATFKYALFYLKKFIYFFLKIPPLIPKINSYILKICPVH